MTNSSDDQRAAREHTRKLLEIYRNKLDIESEQREQLGPQAPSSLILSIQQLETNIAMLEPLAPEPEDEPSKAVERQVRRHVGDDYYVLYRQGVKANERITKVEGTVVTLQTEHNAAQLERIAIRSAMENIRDQFTLEKGDRRTGQLLNRWLLIAAVALLLFQVGHTFGWW